MSDYISSTQQSLIKVVLALGESPLASRSISELMSMTDISYNRVLLSLKNLQHAGWVEKINDNWRLTPTLIQLSERMRLAISDLHNTYLVVNND